MTNYWKLREEMCQYAMSDWQLLVVVRVSQVSPEIPATIRVCSIGFYLWEQHHDVVSLSQGQEASLSYVAVLYPLPRLEKL